MAAYSYTTEDRLALLAGNEGIDLRADDADPAALLAQAVSFATSQVDFYCHRYAQADLAGNQWVNDIADFLGVYWLCLHRLNDVPKGVQRTWEQEIRPKLELIQQGKALVPRATVSRRPVTVTNSTVDLRRWNNQVRVDQSRSTGVAKDYKRVIDPNSPDQR